MPADWPMPLSRRRTEPLEVLAIDGLPEHAVPAFEAAFQTVCATVAYFRDDPTETWRIEAVREAGVGEDELTGALALAAMVSGIEPPALLAGPIEAEGWLARHRVLPEAPIGRRFLVRPTHVANPVTYGRIVLRLDAGLAFGSGEHASTQGCLMAFEAMAHRSHGGSWTSAWGPVILGTAAANMAEAAGAGDGDRPGRMRVAAENVASTGVRLLAPRLADGWKSRRSIRAGRDDLVFAISAPALRHGAGAGAASGAGRDGDPRRAARHPGADGAGGASAAGAGAGTADHIGP